MLSAAKALIADEQHWTKGAMARDKDGALIANPVNKEAVCWCSQGAIIKAYGDAGFHFTDILIGIDLMETVIKSNTDFMNVIAFNDVGGRTHSEVLEMFDRTIEAAKERL